MAKIILPALLILAASLLNAKTIYVDGKMGDDQRAGDTQMAQGTSGPVRSLARAVSLLEAGDILSISAEGGPYRESLILYELTGKEEMPIVIEGNGALLDLGRDISNEEWRPDGGGWVCDAIRAPEGGLKKQQAYGFYQGKPIGVAVGKPGPYTVESTPDGLLRFHLPDGVRPPFAGFYWPEIFEGVQLRKTVYVTIRNLNVRGARNDGFSFHGLCRNLFIEDCYAVFCGDEGASAHGSAEGVFRRCLFARNGSRNGGVTDVHESKTQYSECVSAFNRGAGFSFEGAAHRLEKCLSVGNAFPEKPYAKVESIDFEVIPAGKATREALGGKAEDPTVKQLLAMWTELADPAP